MMSNRDCLTLAITVLFEVIVLIIACPESYAGNMDRLSSDLNSLWKRTERI